MSNVFKMDEIVVTGTKTERLAQAYTRRHRSHHAKRD